MTGRTLFHTVARVSVFLTPRWLMAQVNPPSSEEDLQGPEYSHSVALSPDGRFALVGHATGEMKLWELETGSEAASFTGHRGAVVSVAFGPDGEYAISGGADSTIRLWDVSGRKVVRNFRGHRGAILSVAISEDGQRVLSGSSDRTMRLWNAASGQLIRTFRGRRGYAGSAVAFCPDDKHVLMGNTLWDASTGKEVRTFGPTGRDGYWKDSARFTNDGQFLWIGETMYEVESGIPVCVLDGLHGSSLHTIYAYGADGNRVVGGGGGEYGTVDLWEAGCKDGSASADGPASVRPVSGFTATSSPVTALSVSSDGESVLIRTLDVGTARAENLSLFRVAEPSAAVASFVAR